MYTHFFKRIFDFILALIALIILSPFLIPISLILLLTGEHEVLYLQKRVGFKNSRFKIWKYATMMKNSSKMGTSSLTVRNDPRVLPIGKFLHSNPGITGIGSIIFRDEEKWISNAPGDKHVFYKEHIAPYKGELEIWYQSNLSFYTDFMLLFLTAWSIIAPESELVYSVFNDLPVRPAILK